MCNIEAYNEFILSFSILRKNINTLFSEVFFHIYSYSKVLHLIGIYVLAGKAVTLKRKVFQLFQIFICPLIHTPIPTPFLHHHATQRDPGLFVLVISNYLYYGHVQGANKN